MTEPRSPRHRKQDGTPRLALRRKRALLAEIITSNRSVFKPGLNPDMDAAERDALVKYIESLERWEAGLGRAGSTSVADELDWRADVLDSEITSWTHILLEEPTLSSADRSCMMKTIGEFECWRVELMAQKGAIDKIKGPAAVSRRRR